MVKESGNISGASQNDYDLKVTRNIIEKTKLRDALEKLLSIEELPSFEDVYNLFYGINNIHDAGYSRATWRDFCAHYNITIAYNKEFVDELADVLRDMFENGLDPPFLELYAGNGKLSYHLRKRGIDAIAIDDYSWINRDAVDYDVGLKYVESFSDYVEGISHREALEKYRPEVVFLAYEPPESNAVRDVMNSRDVKRFIYVEDALSPPLLKYVNEFTGNGKTWEMEYVKGAEKYQITLNDKISDRQSAVMLLFSRKSNLY